MYEFHVIMCIFCVYCEYKKMHAMNHIKLGVTVQNILALAPEICALKK
jgi:hypothetical protein